MRQFQNVKVPYVLAVCSVLALNGCTEKKKPDEEKTEGAAADAGEKEGGKDGEQPITADEPPVTADGRPAVLATVLPHDKGVVFGHFVVPNGAQLLAETKSQLMIPAYQGFLDEAALRSRHKRPMSGLGPSRQSWGSDLAQLLYPAYFNYKRGDIASRHPGNLETG